MDRFEYLSLKTRLAELGYGKEAEWARDVKLCGDADTFATEAIWVIISAGMKNQVVERVFRRVLDALKSGFSPMTVFHHPSKGRAIDWIWRNRSFLFNTFHGAVSDEARIAFLRTLPWIGEVTKYHLARNLGLDVCKPDRHLVRIAQSYFTTPKELCARLARETGDRVGVVDVVLWRAANLRILLA